MEASSREKIRFELFSFHSSGTSSFSRKLRISTDLKNPHKLSSHSTRQRGIQQKVTQQSERAPIMIISERSIKRESRMGLSIEKTHVPLHEATSHIRQGLFFGRIPGNTGRYVSEG